MMLLLALSGCGVPLLQTEVCACPTGVEGHAARDCTGGQCGACMCLPSVDPTADPDPTTTFWLDTDAADGGDGSESSRWTTLDWVAIDTALTQGPVLALFDAADTWPERIEISRTDRSGNRLVLDGRTWGDGQQRAIAPGITTGYELVSRDHITIRGFEVTGSRDKGIRFTAGDDIVIEDNVVHENRGSPAINFGYANRTGLPSSGIVVRNNHVYRQASECIYIGGSEGEDQPAHDSLVLENNLVHHCWKFASGKHDGINVKDRIGEVLVRRNVVFRTDWGIEAASTGTYSDNLTFDTDDNGYHFSDGWGDGWTDLVFEHNTALRSGDHGLRLSGDAVTASNVRIADVLIAQSRSSGIRLAGNAGLSGTIEDLTLVGNDQAFDGWGEQTWNVTGCVLADNADSSSLDVEAQCTEGSVQLGDLTLPAGEDGLFFTDDDPWSR